MKKTLMVLAAMMCIAQADTVITFEETAPDFATDNMYINA